MHMVLCFLIVSGQAREERDCFSPLEADRAAVERVYHRHRQGSSATFDEVLPGPVIKQLVQKDLRKERVLQEIYGIRITSSLMAAEIERIESTTRAPKILAELKAALGDDANRFGRTVATPILVERLLRARFENDDGIHAGEREKTDVLRKRLLQAKKSGRSAEELLEAFKQSNPGEVSEWTWKFVRQAEDGQAAEGGERKFYFEDLPLELQEVLREQLREAGDISAVIELPNSFQLYLATEVNTFSMSAALWSTPKRDYERWVEEMAERGARNSHYSSVSKQTEIPGQENR